MKKWLVGVALAVLSCTSQAGFVDTDWKVAGDGLATLHEETGVEWLKVTNTLGQSVAQVQSQMGPGGALEGWRIPTSEEIVTLWESTFEGSSMLSNPQGTRRNYSLYTQQAQDWVSNMGEVTPSPTIRSYGLGYKENGQLGFFGVSRASDQTSYWYGYGDNTTDYTNQYMGVLLVSDGGVTLSSINNPFLNIQNPQAPINQVSAPLLGGFGLIMVGFLLKRRKVKA